jgi:hypothetical protein
MIDLHRRVCEWIEKTNTLHCIYYTLHTTQHYIAHCTHHTARHDTTLHTAYTVQLTHYTPGAVLCL